MGTFTITQVRESANLFLTPSADGCHIGLTPIGDTNNWKCIDDNRSMPDEDSTYNYGNSPSLKYDLYELPNHTTETGTINYIQVFTRAKSYPVAQHEDGIYKIILTDDACSNIYKSDDIDLTTGYMSYNKVCTINPRTTAAWTWNDIDNLQIGLECNSPEVEHVLILTIRPIASGDVTQLTPEGDSPNWKCVDDITRDDTATVVKMYYNVYPGYDETLYDLYNLTNYTTEIGPISKIVVFAWVYAYDSYSGKAVTVIKIGGNTYYAMNTIQSEDTWVLISTEYTENPSTASSWTWGDIDNLQAGIRLNEPYEIEGYTICTQLYVAVYHTEQINPEIRTTLCYAKVNYTPPDIECILTKPEEISTNHDRNIKMLNFWDGTRAVYDLSRNSKTIVLTGSEYQSDTCNSICPCERITCINNMGKDGSTITISGLRSLFNGNYKIRSFGWKHISKKPENYEWILELEYDD